MATNKWCLLKASDGNRGDSGKKKVYEVIVDENVVSFSWGMAEKSRRQNNKIVCGSNQTARWKAFEKVQEKLDKGYVLAYTA